MRRRMSGVRQWQTVVGRRGVPILELKYDHQKWREMYIEKER